MEVTRDCVVTKVRTLVTELFTIYLDDLPRFQDPRISLSKKGKLYVKFGAPRDILAVCNGDKFHVTSQRRFARSAVFFLGGGRRRTEGQEVLAEFS